MTAPDYEAQVVAAERELGQAQTAEDVRRIWRKYFGTLGHRTLGRLLVGRPASELIARREARSSEE